MAPILVTGIVAINQTIDIYIVRQEIASYSW